MRAASVNLMPDGPIGLTTELAVLAERLGYRRCCVYDEGLATRDVFVTLAAIAAGTAEIQLGTGITNPFVRHPGATVTAIASIDEISGGRTFLGLGAGGGLTLDPLAIRRARPVEAVRFMVETTRRLLAGDVVDAIGPISSYTGARFGYGRADIPIFMAGRGPRMTALGAELADGFNLSYLHKDLIGETVMALR